MIYDRHQIILICARIIQSIDVRGSYLTLSSKSIPIDKECGRVKPRDVAGSRGKDAVG